MNGVKALVTGGARRLGRDIALALARRGADVVIHFRHSEDEARGTCEAIAHEGVRAWAVRANLANAADAERAFHEAEEISGGINLLINNASVFEPSTLADFSEEDLARNVRINAMAPLWLSRALARMNRPASIVNLLDTRVIGPDDKHAAYHLSKRMLLTLTRMMAREYAPQVRVNAVAPGLILPPEGLDNDYLESLARDLPLQRYGSAADVAAAVVFLAESPFVTGQIIYVDGGRHLEGNHYV